MATQFVTSLQLTSDALYQTLLNAIDTAITSLGLVHVTQTGEWASSGTTRDGVEKWRIYRFDDSLQSSCSIFFRFGITATTTFSGSITAIKLTAGSGANGSGALTGQTSQNTGSMIPGANGVSLYFAGGTNYFAFTVFNNPITTGYGGGAIERERDNSGLEVADGYYFHSAVNSVTNGGENQYIPAVGARGNVETPFILCGNNAVSSGADGSDNYGSPVHVRRGYCRPHGICAACVIGADFPVAATDISIELYGVTRTYKRIAGTTGSTQSGSFQIVYLFQ